MTSFHRRGARASLVVLGLLAAHTGAEGGDPPKTSGADRTAHDVACRTAAVVSVSRPASEAGLEILKNGGNAVDAAVTTAIALAVTWPEAGNIGGGGYLLLVPNAERSPKGKGDAVVVDFREIAPAAATKEMFVDPGQRTPHRRVAVPGTVRGLARIHAERGRRSWKELVAPAIVLARDGFELDAATADSINGVLKTSPRSQFAELHRVFGRSDGRPWTAGDRLIQPDLAETLERIAVVGADGFYGGGTADRIVAEMRRGGGLITTDDLAAYKVKFREPLRGTYRGHEIVAVPPSSSGGTTLIQMLNQLETFDLGARQAFSAETSHRMIEAMRRAYRNRARWLADPDFARVPADLISKEFAHDLAKSIDPRRATRSDDLAGDIPLAEESENTTHFSIVDADRNAVSCTYTLESSWGSRIVVPGAGFVLNDEMNDFNWLPGRTDRAGRIGTEANIVAPGKRPLSSMCPTIVCAEGTPALVTGSPGGRTIINTVLQVVVHVVDYKMTLRDAVDAPRIHHPWYPDVVRVESEFARQHAATLDRLRAMGHSVATGGKQGDAHSIAIDAKSGWIHAVADKRRSGFAAGY